jgi:LPS sulfotransferase NodH
MKVIFLKTGLNLLEIVINMKKIVILSTQRSGSTMVCDDFEGTGVLGRPSEYFIKTIEGFEPNNSEKSVALLKEVEEKGLGSNGVTSVKIMSNQIQSIIKIILDSKLVSESRPDYAFQEYFKDAFFVRVNRLDKVAQAVSRLSASKTGIYHTSDKSDGLQGMLGKLSHNSRDESSLVIKDQEILEEINKIEKEEHFLSMLCEKLDIKVTTINYEDCTKDQSYLDLLFKKEPIKIIKKKERRLKKVSGVKSKEIIEKFKQKNKLKL